MCAPKPMDIVAEVDMESTLDGSVDIRGKPACRRKTGGFQRACFILGENSSLI